MKKRDKINFERESQDIAASILTGDDSLSNDFALLTRLRNTGDSWTEYRGELGKEFLVCNGLYSHSSIGSNEIGIANAIRYRQSQITFSMDRMREALKGENLAESQIRALVKVLSNRISALTGGPGTGKTTCMRTLCRYYHGSRLLMVSPTGMGAKRLADSSGIPASTVHRALGYTRGVFKYDENNKLDCEVCVIDESSMLGISTAYALIKALRDDCILVFVGDFNQLPSVEPGNLFQDIVESIPTGTLTEVFRTSKDGPVGKACESIMLGKCPEDVTFEDSYFKTIDCDTGVSVRMICDEISSIVSSAKCDPWDIRLCSSTNDRCYFINQAMLKHYPLVIPYRQTRNDYKIGSNGIFNGEIGLSRDGGKTAVFDDEAVEVSYSMEVSYCSTIHAIQGSESDSVIFIVPRKGGDRLSRNLIYTAISRAKKRAIVIGDTQSFFSGVSKQPTRRRTLLSKMIMGKVKYEE